MLVVFGTNFLRQTIKNEKIETPLGGIRVSVVEE